MASVEAAASFAAAYPIRPILLGVEPDRPETQYGWIEAGDVIGERGGNALYVVKRFLEKPDLATAQSLYLNGCLWNTLVLVGRASMLLQLFKELTPELYTPFERLRPVLGSSQAQEGRAVEALYAGLPSVNFSRTILARSPSLPWGHPGQRDLLERLGKSSAGQVRPGSP
ncbi:MAG: sugar phosphate nucleotidyltransferase [Candidatus Methylomirabilis sp.]|nr:sugar phosphate nucleotidyltransferase [Candidatus Methylomirabilis sp.]